MVSDTLIVKALRLARSCTTYLKKQFASMKVRSLLVVVSAGGRKEDFIFYFLIFLV